MKAVPADMEIAVSALPASLGKIADIYVALSVGTDGKATGCAPAPTPSDRSIALGAVACKQLSTKMWAPLKDPAGNPVASVQQVLVRFSATS